MGHHHEFDTASTSIWWRLPGVRIISAELDCSYYFISHNKESFSARIALDSVDGSHADC